MKTLITQIVLLFVATIFSAHAANLVPQQTVTFFDVQPGIPQTFEQTFPEQSCWPLVVLQSDNPHLIAQIQTLRRDRVHISVSNTATTPQSGIVLVFREDPACEEINIQDVF